MIKHFCCVSIIYTSVLGAEFFPGIMQSKELVLFLLLQPPDLLPDLTQELGQSLGGVWHCHSDKSWLLHQNLPCYNIPTKTQSLIIQLKYIFYCSPCYKKSFAFIRTIFNGYNTLLLFIFFDFFNNHFVPKLN